MHSYVSYYTLAVRGVDGQSGQKAKTCLFPLCLSCSSWASFSLAHSFPHCPSQSVSFQKAEKHPLWCCRAVIVVCSQPHVYPTLIWLFRNHSPSNISHYWKFLGESSVLPWELGKQRPGKPHGMVRVTELIRGQWASLLSLRPHRRVLRPYFEHLVTL